MYVNYSTYVLRQNPAPHLWGVADFSYLRLIWAAHQWSVAIREINLIDTMAAAAPTTIFDSIDL